MIKAQKPCEDCHPDISLAGEGDCSRCGWHQSEHRQSAPSNANTSGLEVVAWAGIGLASGEPCEVSFVNALTEEEKQAGWRLEPLVTAASAQARIAELQSNVADAEALAFTTWPENGVSVTWQEMFEAMRSRFHAAEARADRLAKALDVLQDLFAREGECSMERFERIAEMFRKDTGYLAPGKDPGMLSQQPEGDELRRIYDEWYAAKITDARAALQQEG